VHWIRPKWRFDGAGQQLHRPSLGETRCALDEDMAAREQRDEQPLDQDIAAEPDGPKENP
jgi:hypothetical protein